MNLTLTTVRCEAEVGFTDFDGSRESMPCDRPATDAFLLVHDPYLTLPGEATTDVLHTCPGHARDLQDDEAHGNLYGSTVVAHVGATA